MSRRIAYCGGLTTEDLSGRRRRRYGAEIWCRYFPVESSRVQSRRMLAAASSAGMFLHCTLHTHACKDCPASTH